MSLPFTSLSSLFERRAGGGAAPFGLAGIISVSLLVVKEGTRYFYLLVSLLHVSLGYYSHVSTEKMFDNFYHTLVNIQ